MEEELKIHILVPFLILGILVAAATLVAAAFSPRLLRVSVLNVGQGDSIFIESPDGNKMIIDGGPDQSVLSSLGRQMPFYDRSIDVMLATHPDSDHTTGLIYVLDHFHVGAYIDPNKNSGTATYNTLIQKISADDVPKFVAKRGMDVDFGDGTNFLILYPDHDVSDEKQTNYASIIAKLSYGNTSFMLTGDAPKQTEDYVTNLGGINLKSNVLKSLTTAPPHLLVKIFFLTVSPEFAAISAGKNNMYHLPATSTVEALQNIGAKVLQHSMIGDINFDSDGIKFWQK